MSYQLSQLANCTPLPKGKGGATTTLVYGRLCGHAGHKTHSCEVSVDRLAWETQRSLRMVQYALADLIAWGAISRSKGGQHSVDKYTVNLRWLEAQHQSSEARFKIVKRARRAERAASEVQSIAPLGASRGATHCAPEVQPIAPKQSHEQSLLESPPPLIPREVAAVVVVVVILRRRHEGLNGWQPTAAMVEQIRRERPDLSDARIRQRTAEWSAYAAENGNPKNLAAAWRGFLLKTPKPQKSRGFQL